MPEEVPFKIYFHTTSGNVNDTPLASQVTLSSPNSPVAYVSKEDFILAVVRAAGIWSDSSNGRTFKYMGSVTAPLPQSDTETLVIPEIVDFVDEVAACNALDHSIIEVYEGSSGFSGADGAATADERCIGPTVQKRFLIRFYTKFIADHFKWFPASVTSAGQDLVSTAVHEFGHTLGLNHLDPSGDPRAGAMGIIGLANSSARGRDFTEEDFACMDARFPSRQSYARIIRRTTGNWPNNPAADWAMIQPHGNASLPAVPGQPGPVGTLPPTLFDDAAAGRDFAWWNGPYMSPVMATTSTNFSNDLGDPRHLRVRSNALTTPAPPFLSYDAEVGTNIAPRVGPTVGFWQDLNPTSHRVFYSEAADTHITTEGACSRQHPAYPATVAGNGGCEKHRVMMAVSNNYYASETIYPVHALNGLPGLYGKGYASTQIYSNKPVALASWQANLTAVATRFDLGVGLTAWVHSGDADDEGSLDGDKDVYLSVGAYDNTRLHKPINLGAYGVRSEVGPGMACNAAIDRCIIAYVDPKDSKALVRVFTFRVVPSAVFPNTSWAQPFTIVSLGTQVMNSTAWSGNRLAVMFEDRTGTANDMWWLAVRSLRSGQPTEMYRKTPTGNSWSQAANSPWPSKTGPATSQQSLETQPFFAITQ